MVSAYLALLLDSIVSYQIRGFIVTSLDKIWSSSDYLRKTCAGVCVINALVFYFEMNDLYGKNSTDFSEAACESCSN